MVLDSASSSARYCYVAASVADVYGQISKQYITEPLGKLSILVGYDPVKDTAKIEKARSELEKLTKEAKLAIESEIESRLSAAERALVDRMQAIERFKASLPPPADPQKQLESEQSIKDAQKKVEDEKKNPPDDSDWASNWA